MNPDCQTCANAYHGADGVDYCRPANSQRGIKCSPAAADGCKQYEPADVITVYLCDCMGRGDSGN